MAYEEEQSREEREAAELRAENEDEARCSFSPVDPDLGTFPKGNRNEPSPHDLYNKLGIDLSMTVPHSDHLNEKLNPEVATPRLSLVQELGLQLSETKMNGSFSNSPYNERQVENVKRKIISTEKAPAAKSIFDIAKMVLEMTEKDPGLAKLVFDPNHNFFQHLPTFTEVFDSVALQVENIRTPIKHDQSRLREVKSAGGHVDSPAPSNFPGSPDSVLDFFGDDFSLPP